MSRVGKHHAAIGLDGRTANLDGLVHRLAQVKRRFEVFEYVANRYRLSFCHYPTRADHDGHPFREAANDFERRTAIPNDDAGPQFDERRPKLSQHVARFVSALEMC